MGTWRANYFHVNLDVLSLCEVETRLSRSHCEKVPFSAVLSANAKVMDVLEKQTSSCRGPYLPAQKYQIGKRAEAEGFDISRNFVHSARKLHAGLEIRNQVYYSVNIRNS